MIKQIQTEIFKNDPIMNVKIVDTRELNANDYNPNVVLNDELKLLKLSILKNGFIQPILIDSNGIIIDGYHRYFLMLNDKELIQKFNYNIPACILELSDSERMLLTIRINRAKGNHIAFKLHNIVSKLVEDGLSKEYIGENIGARKDEIELLLQEDVFNSKDTKNHKYSKAWVVSDK